MPDTADHCLDALSHCGIQRLVWRAEDSYTTFEARHDATPQEPRILTFRQLPYQTAARSLQAGAPKGSLLSTLDVILHALDRAKTAGLREIHIHHQAGILAWDAGTLHFRVHETAKPAPDIAHWLATQPLEDGLFRIRALPSHHARLEAAQEDGPRTGLPVLDGTAIADRLVEDRYGSPALGHRWQRRSEGLLACHGPLLALVHVFRPGPTFIRL